MFDIGFWELTLIAIVVLLVMRPERIPAAAVAAGQWLRKIKGTIHSLRSEIRKELSLWGKTDNLSDQMDNLDRLLKDAPDKKPSD